MHMQFLSCCIYLFVLILYVFYATFMCYTYFFTFINKLNKLLVYPVVPTGLQESVRTAEEFHDILKNVSGFAKDLIIKT